MGVDFWEQPEYVPLPKIEKRLCLHQYLTPFPMYFGSSIFFTSLHERQCMLLILHPLCFRQQSWSFKSAQDLNSSCYASTAQIWRPSPTDSSQYLLVGENTLFDTEFCSDYLSENSTCTMRLFKLNNLLKSI